MKERKKRKREKISRKSLVILVVIAITFPLLITGIVSFSPYPTGDGAVYISASDILKNFKFESIGGEPIIDEGAFNDKLRFDTQATWVLYEDDVTAISYTEVNDTTYLKYRIVLRNKINMYTNVRINQMAQDITEKSTDYLGMYYVHKSVENNIVAEWEQYITWEHRDFGDIKDWNWRNNYFSGRITMSFDIDDNPVPDTFGDNTEKNFDYIAVSSAGIISNSHGLMSTDMPSIVVLEPSEEEIEEKEPAAWELGPLQDEDYDYAVQIYPNVDLIVPTDPIESFDSSILPDTAGASMNPTNKDGTDIWDPEDEKSMTGCKIHYDLSALSPIVYKWQGKLTYNEYYLHTEHEYTESIWDWWATYVNEEAFYYHGREKYNDVALHGINRYIQTDMYVAFDIWTSVTLGTLTDYYENMRLEAPAEYYDTLIWSTLAEGWTGSEIREGGDPVDSIWESLDEIFDSLFGGLEGLIMIVILIAVLGIGGYVFLVVGVPALKSRQMRKQYENIDRRKQVQKQYEPMERRR